jgi:hypothetical protein
MASAFLRTAPPSSIRSTLSGANKEIDRNISCENLHL